MNSYSDLKVWQKAMDLVVECYKFTKSFPKEEPSQRIKNAPKLDPGSWPLNPNP